MSVIGSRKKEILIWDDHRVIGLFLFISRRHQTFSICFTQIVTLFTTPSRGQPYFYMKAFFNQLLKWNINTLTWALDFSISFKTWICFRAWILLYMWWEVQNYSLFIQTLAVGAVYFVTCLLSYEELESLWRNRKYDFELLTF